MQASTSASGPSATETSGSVDSQAAADQLEAQIIADSGLQRADSPPDYVGTRTVTGPGWTYQAPADWTVDYQDGDNLITTPDLDAFDNGKGPGIRASLVQGTSPQEALQAFLNGSGFYAGCTVRGELRQYAVGDNSGVAQAFSSCGGEGVISSGTLIAVAPNSQPTTTVLMDTTTNDTRDIAAIAEAIRTFNLS